jgi:subtilisin family serine protease
MAAEQRKSERNAWYTFDLVVVLEHRAAVEAVLKRWDVRWKPPVGNDKDQYESQDLGLALIRLATDEQAPAKPDEEAATEADEEAATEVDEKAAAKAVAGLRHDAGEDKVLAAWLTKAKPKGEAGAAETPDAAITAQLESVKPGMDRLLWALRTYFAAKNEGWVPTLGKNRLVGDVEDGNGQVQLTRRTLTSAEEPAWRPKPTTRRKKPGIGVRVGVLDTSIFPHPWLVGGLVGPSEDFLAPGLDDYPADAGHGTFVAGLIMRKAPGCVIEYRKVLSDDDGTATSWDVAKKIVELGRAGVDVLNLSLACYTEDGQPPLVLARAIDRLNPDIVVVAAAGNHGDVELDDSDPDHPVTIGDQRKPSWPAALDDVVAVGAGDDEQKPASFTPKGVPWIDVLSNGVGVSSTYLYGKVGQPGTPEEHEPETFQGYATGSGTSFSAALVSGAIAARTVPGQRSAPQAWRAILAALEKKRRGARPPFLRLL